MHESVLQEAECACLFPYCKGAISARAYRTTHEAFSQPALPKPRFKSLGKDGIVEATLCNGRRALTSASPFSYIPTLEGCIKN